MKLRLAFLLTLLLLLTVAHAATQRPNLILMMGDDHGWEETGYHGHPHVKTPVLDEMARTGLRFDRFYAAHPSCSPTRAIIEGRFKLVIHEQKSGEPRRELFDLEADPAEKNDLAAQQPTVADKLQTSLRAWQDSVLRSLTGADYAK